MYLESWQKMTLVVPNLSMSLRTNEHIYTPLDMYISPDALCILYITIMNNYPRLILASTPLYMCTRHTQQAVLYCVSTQ